MEIKKLLLKIWFTYFATKPRIRIRNKDRYRIHFLHIDGIPIDRSNGLGFGLWGGNSDIAVRCLNNFS